MTEEMKPCYKCDGEGRFPSEAHSKIECVVDDSPYWLPCNLCNGDGEIFYIGGEEERFNLLANRWEEETIHHSVIQTEHPCFIAMNKMKSKEAIVWILERMKKEPTHLMALLEMWVKKSDNPIPDKMYDIEKITEMWIKWGKEKKLIT